MCSVDQDLAEKVILNSGPQIETGRGRGTRNQIITIKHMLGQVNLNEHTAPINYSEEERHVSLSSKSFISSRMVELITSNNGTDGMTWIFESQLISTFPFLELLVETLVSSNNYFALSILSFDTDCYKYIQEHTQPLCGRLVDDVDITKQLDSLVLLLQLTDEQIIDERSMVNLLKSIASNLPRDLTNLRYLLRLIEGSVVEQSGLVKFLFGALIETSDRSVAIDILRVLEYIYSSKAVSIEVLSRSKVMNALFRWLHGRGAEVYWSLKLVSNALQTLQSRSDVETRRQFLGNVIPEVELLFNDIGVLVECVAVYPDVVLLIHSVLNGYVVPDVYNDGILQYMKNVCDETTTRIYAVYVDLCPEVKIDRDIFSGVYQWLATDKSMSNIVNRLFGRVFNCSLQLTFHQRSEREEHVDYSPLLEVSSKKTKLQAEKMREYGQKLTDLQEEIVSKDQLIAELRNTVDQVNIEVTIHLQTCNEQVACIDTLKQTIKDYDQKLCEQEAMNEAIVDKLIQGQQAGSIMILDLQNQVSTLGAQITHKDGELEGISLAYNAARSELNNVNEELEALDVVKQTLENRLEIVAGNMEEEKKIHANLIRDIRQRNHLEKLRIQHNLDELVLSSKQQSEELDTLRNEVHILRTKEISYDAEISKLRMQLEVKGEQLRRDRLEMERLLSGDTEEMFPEDQLE